MSTFKKGKVVILPTNQQTKYLMVYSDVEKTKGKLILSGLKNDEYKEYQHLYIISYIEKPDNGDYYIIDDVPELLKNNGLVFIDDSCRKVIATTDKTLSQTSRTEIPQPSQQFIQKYIEEYNKGNVITDVLVEYDYLLDDRAVLPYWNLKVNTKDNTITIKKLKETYNKEELCQILEKYTSFIWSEVGIHYPISLGKDAKDKFINSEL